MKLPAQPSCALDDDDAASLEASLLEDVAPPEREKEDNTVAILCAAGAAVGALVFGYSLGFSSPALPGMLGRQFKHVRCDANGALDLETLTPLLDASVKVVCLPAASNGAGRRLPVGEAHGDEQEEETSAGARCRDISVCSSTSSLNSLCVAALHRSAAPASDCEGL